MPVKIHEGQWNGDTKLHGTLFITDFFISTNIMEILKVGALLNGFRLFRLFRKIFCWQQLYWHLIVFQAA
jgi:hypothetical protein